MSISKHTARLIILGFLTVTLIGLGAGPSEKHFKKKRPFTHPSHFKSIVLIYSEDGRCSGWVAEKNVVITAGHCMKKVGEKLLVHFEGDSLDDMRVFTTRARILEKPAQAATDMAVLDGPTGDTNPISFASPALSRQWCVSFGYGGELPKASKDPIQQGTICRTYESLEEGGLLATAGGADYGDSGGPVVNQDGQVIGMVESIATDGTNIFFIVPSAELQTFLKSSSQGK